MINLLYTKVLGKIDTIEFDAVLAEQHSGQSVITDLEVEVGANITDHIRTTPTRVNITGIITNTPLSWTSIAGTPRRSEDAYNQLEQLRLNGTLCKVVTTLKTYNDMVIEKIDISRDKDTRNAIVADVLLKHITKAKSKLINIPKPVPAGDKLQTKGKLPTEQASAAQNKSAAASTVDFFSGGVTK